MTTHHQIRSTHNDAEFRMGDTEFRYLCDVLYANTGIVMSDMKRDLVYGRLSRRLRRIGVSDFATYCRLLEEQDDEKEHFINALTTNLTAFFRENHHFEYLRNHAVKSLLARKQQKKLRIWSAGCSTGQEPYSLAMTLADMGLSGVDIAILATDLDTRVLEYAENGSYPSELCGGLSPAQQSRWFTRTEDEHWQVNDDIRRMITFRSLNLMGEWPFRNQFDVIMCRNVLIYFDKQTQTDLCLRFHNSLGNEGFLFLGHSESMSHAVSGFRSLGNTIYQRTSE